MTENTREVGKAAPPPRKRTEGSALLTVMFILVLLTGVGVALLFLGQSELEMSKGYVEQSKAFRDQQGLNFFVISLCRCLSRMLRLMWSVRWKCWSSSPAWTNRWQSSHVCCVRAEFCSHHAARRHQDGRQR